MTTVQGPQLGFQGSETTWAEVTIYQHGDDPIVLYTDGGAHKFNGRKPSDPAHCLIGVQTSKAINQPSGQFSLQLKPSQEAKRIFEWVVDDDWVDIVFYRHDRPFHAMRGLVDQINRVRTVGGTGATTEVYIISGRDFAKVWEQTPLWFSPYADNDLVTQGIANQVMGALTQLLGTPAEVVELFLSKFMEQLSTSAGINWDPPGGMPAITNNSFLESVVFATGKYSNRPPRKQFNPNFINPNGTLWQLAHENSDPLFTEFYADLLPKDVQYPSISQTLVAGETIALGQAVMTVVVRDKPFPVIGDDYPAIPSERFTDYWKEIPVSELPVQQIFQSDLSKNGLERFNAFFIASLLHQEQTGKDSLSIIAPLVDLIDIRRHGMRRMDVQSSMAPDKLDYGVLSEYQRMILRDWYALNPYLLSGTLTLGIGRPDIKIGTRVTIPGQSVEFNENYYVEQVNHGWQFGRGMRTTLGVTRGWIGTDASYFEKLEEKVSRFATYKKPIIDQQDQGIQTA